MPPPWPCLPYLILPLTCDFDACEGVSSATLTKPKQNWNIIEFLRPGDEMVVTRLDRLGRDTRDVLNVIHECEQRQASVMVLDPLVSTRGEMGHVVLTVLGMVAQMERRFIKERQREGIQQAKAQGVYVGGKRRLDRAQVRSLHLSGITPTEITTQLGCSRMQVYRILRVAE